MNEILKFLNDLITILLKPFHKIYELWSSRKLEKRRARTIFKVYHREDIVEFMRELKKTLITSDSLKLKKFIDDRYKNDDEKEDLITDYESNLINGRYKKVAKKFKKLFYSILKNVKDDGWDNPKLIRKQRETLQKLIRYILQS